MPGVDYSETVAAPAPATSATNKLLSSLPPDELRRLREQAEARKRPSEPGPGSPS